MKDQLSQVLITVLAIYTTYGVTIWFVWVVCTQLGGFTEDCLKGADLLDLINTTILLSVYGLIALISLIDLVFVLLFSPCFVLAYYGYHQQETENDRN